MVERKLPKLKTRVRFPSLAPTKKPTFWSVFLLVVGKGIRTRAEGSVATGKERTSDKDGPE